MATYDKVPQAEATEAPLPSPSSQSTVGFTKAALVFDHKLQSIRRKHDSGVSVTSNPSTPGLELKGKQSIVVEEKEIAEKPTEIEIILGRSIRILLALKSIVTGILSVSIAVFQGRAYIIWNNTKNVDGAWPPVPFLAPTLILFSVAIAAFVFDVCLALAYIFPGKRVANKAIKIAQSAYWVISTAKTAGYGVTAVVCRSGFDFGNASGTNSDLWSWTCSDKSDQFSSVNQSESNCECQVRSIPDRDVTPCLYSPAAVYGVVLFNHKRRYRGSRLRH